MPIELIGKYEVKLPSAPDLGRIRPLFQRNDEKERWRTVDLNDFPPQGLVFWPQMPPHVEVGQLVRFEVQKNERGEDHFVVKPGSGRLAPIVYDLSHVETIEELRQQLIQGVPVSQPVVSGCYLWALEDKLIPLIPGENGGLWLNHLSGDIASVPAYTVKSGWLDTLESDGKPRFLIISLQGQPPSEYLDFSHPTELIKTVVTKLESGMLIARIPQMASPPSPEILNPLDALMHIANELDGNTHPRLWVNRLERVKPHLESLSIQAKEMRKATEALLELPAVHEEKERRIREAKQEALEAASQEVLSLRTQLEREREKGRIEVQKLNTELARLKTEQKEIALEVAQLHGKRDALEFECLESEERRDELRNEMRLAADQELRALLADPAGFIVRSELLASYWGRSPELSAQPESTSPAIRLVPSGQGSAPTTRLATWDDTLSAAMEHFERPAVARKALRPIIAAIAAGQLPTLVGPDGLLAVRAVAQVFSTTPLFTLHLNAHVSQVRDLFLHEGPGESARSTGLAELLLAAEREGEPALIHLEGINRAPIEAYLVPLLKWLSEPSQPLTGLDPALAELLNAAGGESMAHWPAHVRLIATLAEGPTTLPSPRSLWGHANLFQPHLGRMKADRQVGLTAVSRTLLSPFEGDGSLSDAIDDWDCLDAYPIIENEVRAAWIATCKLEASLLALNPGDAPAAIIEAIRATFAPFLVALPVSTLRERLCHEVEALLGQHKEILACRFEELSLVGLAP